MVKAHRLLADMLGIRRIEALIGSSVGGFQAVEWAVEEPERIDKLVLIATAAKATPWSIAIDETQRMAIECRLDLRRALRHGRSEGAGGGTRHRAALLPGGPTATTSPSRIRRRSPTGTVPAPTSSTRAKSCAGATNAYSYYKILNAFDTHDVGRGRGGVETALRRITARCLVVGISTDLIFPPSEMRTLNDLLPHSSYHQIDFPFGHDGFLVEHEQLNRILNPFINPSHE